MTEAVNILTAAPRPEEVNRAVARNLRLKRNACGFSLDELARRSGVSKGMLVEIEKGAANPSIAVLCRAAGALGVSVAELIEVSGGPTARLVKPGASSILWQGPRGGTATLLAGTRGPDMLELWRWVMKPGEIHEAPAHPAGTTELVHVERGALVLGLDERRLEVPAGHSAVVATDCTHSYRSGGRRDVVFTMVVNEPRGLGRGGGRGACRR